METYYKYRKIRINTIEDGITINFYYYNKFCTTNKYYNIDDALLEVDLHFKLEELERKNCK